MTARKCLLTAVFIAVLAVASSLAAAASAYAAWGGKGYLGDVESILVTRPAGAHDELWLVNPEDGTSREAGALPGHAGDAAQSPDGLRVAYLPEARTTARVWISDGSPEARTISLVPAGVRRVQGLTWIDAGRLVVAGAARNTANPLDYRLYVVDADAGTVKPYRGIRGIDPSAAPGRGKLAYLSFTRLSRGKTPLVRERLKLLSIGGSGPGRTIATSQYRLLADRRSFARPLLSPDALFFLTGKTAGAERLTYGVRDREGAPLLQVFTPSRQAGAWDVPGTRVAFGGVVPTASTTDAAVWVHDVAAGTLLRTPAGLMGDVSITALDWSPSGTRLGVEAAGYDAQGTSRHLFVLPADLTWFRDLGVGGLPVWIVQ